MRMKMSIANELFTTSGKHEHDAASAATATTLHLRGLVTSAPSRRRGRSA